jgi:hypothetical protein
MKLLRDIWDWAGGQSVGEVPEDDAVCEFDCRKPQCTEGEWENCMRRLQRAAGELMPAKDPASEAWAESTPANSVMPPLQFDHYWLQQDVIGRPSHQGSFGNRAVKRRQVAPF